ncbi:MAG: GNAT family N-acetyltransferase [Planctomycetota bacterium]|jgi:RimJ/RimL family protein N-acetyltransferase
MAERSSEIARRLISTERPEDAVASHYAFACPGSEFHAVRDGDETALLVTARSRLGPVGVFRASTPTLVAPLLEHLPSGRPYITAPWSLAEAISMVVKERERNRVYWLQADRVEEVEPRCGRLRVGDECVSVIVDGDVAAKCSLLWRSTRFAELEVATRPEFRGQGLARSVVSAMAARLISRDTTPIYVASVANAASLRVAEALAFTACKEDEFAGYAVEAAAPRDRLEY